jgi:MSHA biogenesis protein MshO
MPSDMSKGFTLIELVIVIIILSAIGIATSSYITTGVSIYSDVADRDKSINSLRFVIERMRREVANALPNSAIVDGNCLTFTPIIASTLYASDFPIAPLSASSGSIAAIEKAPDGSNKVNNGDRAVVYILDRADLSSVGDTGKSKLISINSAQDMITFTNTDVNGMASYPLGSPAKRLYFIGDNNDISYCFDDNQIKRTDADAANVLMAENISGSFTVEQATLQRNALVLVKFLLYFDEQEAAFEETLHINNVP